MRSGSKLFYLNHWVLLLGLGLLFFQHWIYLLAVPLAGLIGIPPWVPKIPAVDDLFPLIPVFVLPYVGSYVYWVLAPAFVLRGGRRHFLNYLASWFAAAGIGFLFLVFLPTTMDRVAEGLTDFPGESFFDWLLRVVYYFDGGDAATDLFPSFHCLISTLAYLGVRGQPGVPKGYRIVSLILSILICISTLFTKQHYLLDVLGGVTLGIVVYTASARWNWGRVLERPAAFFARLVGKISKGRSSTHEG